MIGVSDAAYEKLQHDLCVGMGFCGGLVGNRPVHVDDFIPETGEVTVEQFLGWLFRAEGDGYPPDFEPKSSSFYDELKSIFVKHMGSVIVDAARLKWHV